MGSRGGQVSPSLGDSLTGLLTPGRVVVNAPMRLHTSFRIGGPVDFLVTVNDSRELLGVLEACRRAESSCFVLGRGTNLLVRDGGIRGVVIRLAGEFLNQSLAGRDVTAGAAVGLGHLARACGRSGLTGLEFAVGIPGSVGGAVVMNAGAYGSEMKDVVQAVMAVRRGREPVVKTLPLSELDFGYRVSRLQREDWIVTEARLRLGQGALGAIGAREEEFNARRAAKQPGHLPSAGSVFKRPIGHFAGELIDQAGCRGRRVGDAQVSELHAGFIVNLGAATARDVLALMNEVRTAVESHSGVRLEPEIRIIGEDGDAPGAKPG